MRFSAVKKQYVFLLILLCGLTVLTAEETWTETENPFLSDDYSINTDNSFLIALNDDDLFGGSDDDLFGGSDDDLFGGSDDDLFGGSDDMFDSMIEEVDAPTADAPSETDASAIYSKGSFRAGGSFSGWEKWAAVLEEYAVRYGDAVKVWWIDGCYADYLKYTDDLLALYADAIRKGNPRALVAMNDGVKPYYAKYYSGEDFTCGEFTDFYVIPRTRFIDGAQAFLLAPLGIAKDNDGWAHTGCKHDGAYMGDFVSLVNRTGGVVAVDVKIHPEQFKVLRAIGRRTGTLA